MSLKDDRNNELSEKAYQAGKEFAKQHPLSEFAQDRDSARLMDNCPSHLQRFADVFKYGCQSVWRRNGELPEMVAMDLEPGDIFKVERPDPECDRRVCLTNDRVHGLRFGFPNKPGYWCSMGHACRVELVTKRCGECENCKDLERVKQRVLACCNPPFSHADQDVVDVWNRELARLPCIG